MKAEFRTAVGHLAGGGWGLGQGHGPHPLKGWSSLTWRVIVWREVWLQWAWWGIVMADEYAGLQQTWGRGQSLSQSCPRCGRVMAMLATRFHLGAGSLWLSYCGQLGERFPSFGGSQVWGSLLQDIRWLLWQFSDCKVTHSPRETNFVADALAGWGHSLAHSSSSGLSRVHWPFHRGQCSQSYVWWLVVRFLSFLFQCTQKNLLSPF